MQWSDGWADAFLGLGALTHWMTPKLCELHAEVDYGGAMVVFLQRHRVELGLKTLLDYAGAGAKNGHNLDSLWRACAAALEPEHPSAWGAFVCAHRGVREAGRGSRSWGASHSAIRSISPVRLSNVRCSSIPSCSRAPARPSRQAWRPGVTTSGQRPGRVERLPSSSARQIDVPRLGHRVCAAHADRADPALGRRSLLRRAARCMAWTRVRQVDARQRRGAAIRQQQRALPAVPRRRVSPSVADQPI